MTKTCAVRRQIHEGGVYSDLSGLEEDLLALRFPTKKWQDVLLHDLPLRELRAERSISKESGSRADVAQEDDS